MSFNLRNFIKNGLLNAVGKMADYQVVLNAAGWHEKGVLTEEDLAEINNAIEARKPVEIEDVRENYEDKT
jgi:hypothetical protein